MPFLTHAAFVDDADNCVPTVVPQCLMIDLQSATPKIHDMAGKTTKVQLRLHKHCVSCDTLAPKRASFVSPISNYKVSSQSCASMINKTLRITETLTFFRSIYNLIDLNTNNNNIKNTHKKITGLKTTLLYCFQ